MLGDERGSLRAQIPGVNFLRYIGGNLSCRNVS